MQTAYHIMETYTQLVENWTEEEQSVISEQAESALNLLQPANLKGKVVLDYQTRSGVFGAMALQAGAQVYCLPKSTMSTGLRLTFLNRAFSDNWSLITEEDLAKNQLSPIDIVNINIYPDAPIIANLETLMPNLADDAVLCFRVYIPGSQTKRETLKAIFSALRSRNTWEDEEMPLQGGVTWRLALEFLLTDWENEQTVVTSPPDVFEFHNTLQWFAIGVGGCAFKTPFGASQFIVHIPYPVYSPTLQQRIEFSIARLFEIHAIKEELSMLHHDALYLLHELVRRTSGTILEIGGFKGGATVTMGTAIQQLKQDRVCISIEVGGPFPHETMGTEDTIFDLRQNVEQYHLEDIVKVLHGRSDEPQVIETVAQTCKAHGSIDLWIMDADGHVERDLKLFAEYAENGCYLFVDDYISVGAPGKAKLTKPYIDKMIEAGVIETLGVVGFGSWVGTLRQKDLI